MSSSLFDDFGSDESPRGQTINKIAHLYPLTVVLWSVFIALTWFEIVNGWWTLLTFLFIVPIIIAQWHMVIARICLRCMQNVPEDAPVRSQTPRNRKLMWLFHSTLGFRFLGMILLGAAVVSAIRYFIGSGAGETTWLNAPMDIFIVCVIWSQWKHHRYRPWCPYCKWGDGGSHEAVPQGVPDPSMTKN